MPYLRLLEQMIRSVDGAQGALLLDSEGEVVVEAGARDYRHRLIGAYQGIGLSTAQQLNTRYEQGSLRYISCRYDWGTVILRPLKDGYYLILSLGQEASVARGLHLSEQTQERMNQEL